MRWPYILGGIGIVATFVADTFVHIDYERAANISLIYVALLTTVFAVRYGIWSNWRANRVGRILFVKSILLPFMMWQITASVWIDIDYPFRQQIRFTLYTLTAVAYLSMDILLWQEQHRDREFIPQK